MKRCFHYFIAISCVVLAGVCVSCHSGEKKTESANTESTLTKERILDAICREAGDEDLENFSVEMIDTIEMYLDSTMLITGNRDCSVNDIVTAKSESLLLLNELVSRGQNCPKEQLDRILDKNDEIQFKFLEKSEGDQHCFELINVFSVENHCWHSMCDYFDFYVFLDMKTKKCDGMICVLPNVFFHPENMPQVYIYLMKSISETDYEQLAITEPEFDEECGTWQVQIHGNDFEKLLTSSNIIFMATDNGENGVETATIRLTQLQKQYANLF